MQDLVQPPVFHSWLSFSIEKIPALDPRRKALPLSVNGEVLRRIDKLVELFVSPATILLRYCIGKALKPYISAKDNYM